MDEKKIEIAGRPRKRQKMNGTWRGDMRSVYHSVQRKTN